MTEQELRQMAQRYRQHAAAHRAANNAIAADYERIATKLETWASGMAQSGVEAVPEPLQIIPDVVLPDEAEAPLKASVKRRKRVADDAQGDAE